MLIGEMGVGKLILLDFLGFVLGWCGCVELVWVGVERGEVVVEFDLLDGYFVYVIFEEVGLSGGDMLMLC